MGNKKMNDLTGLSGGSFYQHENGISYEMDDIEELNIEDEKVLPVEQHKVCPSHPGEILKELYIDEIRIGFSDFCIKNELSILRVQRFIDGKTSCNEQFSNKLSKATNTTPQLWLNLQANYDKWMEVNG